MGIPRLTSHLEPYFETIALGCKGSCHNESISRPLKITIDGPGLAYYVYDKILASARALSAVDAVPPYSEVVDAVLSFLGEVEECNTKITSIHFDGYLPVSKRATRLARLESYLKQLKVYHASNTTGAPLSKKSPTESQSPFFRTYCGRNLSFPAFHRLPALPFLVPSVIEALGSSRYSYAVKLVPGEADSYCAYDAKHNGALILTGDSDLLMYDLGSEGAVLFLNQLSLGMCDTCKQKLLEARICRPKTVSLRLGIDSLLQLGYQIQSDPTTTLAEATRRAKRSRRTSQDDQFLAFAREYEVRSLSHAASRIEAQLGFLSDGQVQLDPRLSELVLQLLETTSSREHHMYLPFMVEDPTRSSCWEASNGIRSIAYSLLVSEIGNVNVNSIIEFGRKGQAIRSNSTSLLNKDDVIEQTKRFIAKIESVKSALPNASSVVFWRAYAMSLVVYWHKLHDKALPQDNTIGNALCSVRTEWKSWTELHLTAQLEATLYSLRVLKQVASLCRTKSSLAKEISNSLSTMPSLRQLMPLGSIPNSSLSQGQVLSLASLWVSNGDDGKVSDPALEIDQGASELFQPSTALRKKKKRKRKSTTTTNSTKIGGSKNNMFGVLSDSTI